MDTALPADPDQYPQLWRANQPIRFHRLMGNESQCGGGSRHRFGKSHLVTGANQYSHGRVVLFQGSAVDELSDSLLSHTLADATAAGYHHQSDLRHDICAPLSFEISHWLGVGLSVVSPQQTTTGAFGFAIKGPPAAHTIFSSSDLAAWNELGTVTNAVGAVVFTDVQATNSPQKF